MQNQSNVGLLPT